MPELPEVEALAAFLRERASGHAVAHAYPAAISVLKTYDPPPTALTGLVIGEVSRHGKFLDLSLAAPGDSSGAPLHLVVHLARAGWLRWREDIPPQPPKPGKGPLAFRVILDDGSGFDLTEQGTQKRLAVYLVRDPMDVPGVASLGPDPLDSAFTAETLAALLAGRRMQIKGVLRDQHIIAGIGNAYSDEVLHAARMSPFKIASSLTARSGDGPVRRDRDDPHRRVQACGGARRRRSEGREEDRAPRARQGRPALPRMRRHDPRGVVRGLGPAVLRHLPDRWQASRRPPSVPPAQVAARRAQ